MRKGKSKGGGPRRDTVQAAVSLRTIGNEIVAELDGTLSEERADALARRHGLRRIESQNFPLIGATIGLFRIADGRSFETVSSELFTDAGVGSLQPNYRYFLQEQKTAPAEGDPAQYVLAKKRLPEALALAHGTGIKIAVIDCGIDAKHHELANSIIDSFDALGSSEGLMGSAPAAEPIAIRAFGGARSGAQSNSHVLLKSFDYATRQNGRIINMSFAGPKDPLIERCVEAEARPPILR